MVQTAVADIIGPTVAAQNPDGFFDEVVSQAQQAFAGFATFFGAFVQNIFEFRNAFALFFHTRISALVGVDNRIHQGGVFFKSAFFGFGQSRFGIVVELVKRQAHTQAKFGVVFKQGVRPSRAFAVVAFAIRRGGQVAAVNGGATRRVGYGQAVAEQLR